VAVVYVKELFEGRSGGDNLERKRNYVRVFEVRTDDANDDAFTAGAGAGIPRNGEPHPSDTFAVMVDIDAMQSSADSTLWLVTCRYSSDLPADQQREALTYDSTGLPSEFPGATSASGGGQATREPDPRDRPPQFEVDWEQKEEIVEYDINGDLITNSATDPFDPPPTAESSYPIITITKNIPIDSPFLDIEQQELWQESTNSDSPWGRPAKTLRIVRVRHSSAVENDIAYAVATLSLKVNRKTWVKKLKDVGFRNIDDVWFSEPGTKALPADPRPLNGAGQFQPAGTKAADLEFDIYWPTEYIPILAMLGVTA
jgi:hypothetical protein